jgi:hypothetical protein
MQGENYLHLSKPRSRNIENPCFIPYVVMIRFMHIHYKIL